MDTNWPILPIVALAILVLLIFIFRQNQKDKNDLTKTLNEDYKKSDEKKSEVNDDVNE